MITMDQYEYIRTAHRVYEKSIRKIEKETGHDRKTIRKVLQGEPAKYARRAFQPYPVLGPYLGVIDGWLEADREVDARQRHTARRVYHRLINEEGFKGGESTVRQYVRLAKIRLGIHRAKAFIPLDPDCGKEAEVDWGCATAIIGGEEQLVKFFCMRSKYSGKHFVRFYPCERQQAFFDGHSHAFYFLGGVFPTLIYDNLTSAVEKVLRGKVRVEQEAFRKFHVYYSFAPRFCNVASAHEKGGVEGLVGFARRNYMVPIPKAGSLEELNERVLKECMAYGNHRMAGRERTVNELFEEEKSHLIALPARPFGNSVSVEGKVNPYATVLLDKNRYSVPTRYAGLRVQANFGVDLVDIYHDGKRIASHRRVFGNNKWQLDPDHYLELLQRRPGAFASARPIREWRKSWPVMLERLLARFVEKQGETAGTRDFISVLMFYRDHPAADVHAAVEQAMGSGVSSSAAVRQLLMYSHPEPELERLKGWPATVPADLCVYGELGGVL
jgi:transposase